jgi:pimeloyl-ACP methyl ester carboxylesterase
MKFLSLFALFTALLSAAPKVELGEINGAAFRIDVPDDWNGGLVLFCHGYSTTPAKFDSAPKPTAPWTPFLKAGYAVAQSGYAGIGWAIEEATADTLALRRYFITKYGKPKEIFISGQSMGGFTTMVLMEQFPSEFDAGLSLCGPLAGAMQYKLRTAFEYRVLFDYYFPGILPPPDRVPHDFERSKDVEAKVLDALKSKPDVAETLRRYTGIRTDAELANLEVFWTYQLMDMAKRAGGNAFDNRNVIYVNVPDNNAVNDGVKRYKADPKAVEYLKTFYAPTGKLTKPMLAIHTTYDPLAAPWVPSGYAVLTENAGNPDKFVLQYVKHDGHCKIELDEIARGFDQLRRWKETGQLPPSGWNH